MSKTILITGGTGFIGSNLCKRLIKDENNKIICVDNNYTGSLDNVKELLDKPRFRFIEHDIVIGISGSVSAIGNIGPGFGHVIGPMGSFEALHNSSKLILSFCMLIGRLELIPFLVFLEKDFYNFKFD